MYGKNFTPRMCWQGRFVMKTLTVPHVKHCKRFLNWPWNKLTITLELRLRYFSQAIPLASQSGSCSKRASWAGSSGDGGGRLCTKLRSSWSPSNKKLRNSCESCCSVPSNWGANRMIASCDVRVQWNETLISKLDCVECQSNEKGWLAYTKGDRR